MAIGDALGADRRVALVIGNSTYREAPLRNPASDARAMAQALRGLGFQTTLVENSTKSQMERAVAQFGDTMREGDTALFFFAGHGIQVNGRNYLVPVDAAISTEHRVRLESLDVEAILEQMHGARTKVSIVILDACRNNPFERRFRSAGRGLAQVSAPEGALIAYATAPGMVASDGDGRNGLYTGELLRALSTPGLKIEDVFKRVRVAVSQASRGGQVPWEASSLTGDFYFTSPGPSVAGGAAVDREALFWETIKNSSNPADYRAYLEQFPTGTFAPLARSRASSPSASSQSATSPASPQSVATMPPVASRPVISNAARSFQAVLPAHVVQVTPTTIEFSIRGTALAAGITTRLNSAGASVPGGAHCTDAATRIDPDGSFERFFIRCSFGASGPFWIGLSGTVRGFEDNSTLFAEVTYEAPGGKSGTVVATSKP